MSIEKFLSLSAIILGFIGTVFLLKGVLRLTRDVIGEIGQTRFGYSIQLIENLVTQKADTICGFILIVIAFSLQLIQAVPNLSVIRLPGTNLRSYILTIIFIVIISVIMLSINFGIRKYNSKKARIFIVKYYVELVLLKDDILDLAQLHSVEVHSSELLDLTREKKETDNDFLLRLGTAINIDFSKKLKPTPNGNKN